MNIKKILKKLYVLEEVSNKNRNPKLGKGFTSAYKFRAWNPLSYIVIVVTIVVAIFMYGFIGAWKEMDLSNPFKWN